MVRITPVFDWILRGGTVFDGSGGAPYVGDVGVKGDKIVAAGPGMLSEASEDGPAFLPADRIIDVTGLAVTPGLIDAHVHTDLSLLATGNCEGSLLQGVTTHVIGQDGISYAPLTEQSEAFLRPYFAAINGNPSMRFSWRNVGEFLQAFDGASPINVAYLIPHGTVRLAVMGEPTRRRPTRAEIARMQRLIDIGMAEGAIGFSTGLDYLPCGYATTAELIDLAKAAAGGGIFVTHMRDYKERAKSAIRETALVGEAAGLPVHISHFNCDLSALDFVKGLQSAGGDITFDAYPYLAGSTVLMLALPWTLHRGTVDEMVQRIQSPKGWKLLRQWVENPRFTFESIVLAHVQTPEFRRFLGWSLPQAAQEMNVPLVEFVRDLLVAERMAVGVLMFQDWRGEDDLKAVLKADGSMIGSDGIYVGDKPHPRGYGAFARCIRKARDEHWLPLPEMIRRMTSVPAHRFGLKGRGMIGAGMMADIAVFDLDRVTDTATYEHGKSLAQGLKHLFVNGEPVVIDEKVTRSKPGRALTS